MATGHDDMQDTYEDPAMSFGDPGPDLGGDIYGMLVCVTTVEPLQILHYTRARVCINRGSVSFTYCATCIAYTEKSVSHSVQLKYLNI